MNSVAIIPARGGSFRIPRKNIRDFHGKPIIAYSIETAKESGLFDRIIVSTDSGEISKVAIEYGAEIHVRSKEMARDEVGTQEVVKNVLEELKINDGYVCCIYPTAPLMSVDDLTKGFDMLEYHQSDFDYTFSVGTNPLCDAGQFYWGKANSFIKEVPVHSEYSVMIPIEEKRVCDINTMDDWLRAEEMYADLYLTEGEIMKKQCKHKRTKFQTSNLCCRERCRKCKKVIWYFIYE